MMLKLQIVFVLLGILVVLTSSAPNPQAAITTAAPAPAATTACTRNRGKREIVEQEIMPLTGVDSPLLVPVDSEVGFVSKEINKNINTVGGRNKRQATPVTIPPAISAGVNCTLPRTKRQAAPPTGEPPGSPPTGEPPGPPPSGKPPGPPPSGATTTK